MSLRISDRVSAIGEDNSPSNNSVLAGRLEAQCESPTRYKINRIITPSWRGMESIIDRFLELLPAPDVMLWQTMTLDFRDTDTAANGVDDNHKLIGSTVQFSSGIRSFPLFSRLFSSAYQPRTK